MLLDALRATGFDPPFGHPSGAHPGVRLESHFWRLVDPAAGRVVLAFAVVCRDDRGAPWASLALASQDAGGLRAELGPDDHLDVRFAAPRPWSRPALGGLGMGHVVPGLTQYWHPHLLGARVVGGARLSGEDVALDGAHAYGEKNWGRGGFPPAWWWGQAFLPGGDATVAFAGGVLGFGALGSWKATALAVRIGDELAAWAPPQLLRTRVDRGAWRLDARGVGDGLRVRIEATARGAPLDLPVPLPSERRTERLSHQHQDGRLALAAWRRGRLVLAEDTRLAGLERGGPALPDAVVRAPGVRG